MTKLRCADYGFDCKFVSDHQDKEKLIDEFAKHTANIHGIDYSKEVLMQFIIRKG